MGSGRFLFGFFLIWGVMFGAGAALGNSVELGLLALAATLAAAGLWEHRAFGTPRDQLLRVLGFGRPVARSLVAGLIISSAVLAFYPAYVLVSGNDLPLRSDWLLIAIGLFAYNGLAEELAWRGYAFRRLREGRTFGAAIGWTMPLLAVTHVPILITHGPAVGSLAIVVAAVTCLPFAYLWERGGKTIWAAAMLHASIDAFKVLEVPTGDEAVMFSVSLGLVSLVVPLGVFVFGDRFFGAAKRHVPAPAYSLIDRSAVSSTAGSRARATRRSEVSSTSSG